MPLRENDLANTVLKKISVDEFEPKTGTSENVLVLGFQLSENLPSKDLYKFLNNSIIEMRDIEVSPNPNPDGYYMVFVEMDRQEEVLNNIKSIVEEVERLSGKLNWEVSTTLSEESIALDNDELVKYIQIDPENYMTKDEFVSQQEAVQQKEEEHRLEEEAKDNSNTILEFLKASNILEAGLNDGKLHLRGARDVATLEVINFGHGPDVMSEVGISESAIKLEHDKVAMAKLNAMLGEMKALPIDEYIVIYNPAHKDILVTKAS
jgi:hypothetical protein